MRGILFLFFLLTSVVSFSQKKVINPNVYNDWKQVKNATISNDGKFVVYEINPHRGDGFLYIYNTATNTADSIPRGKKAKIAGNSAYVAFEIDPGYDTLRTCELKKVDKKKWPKDTLGIYLFDSDSLIKVANLKSFEVNENSGLMTYFVDANELSTPEKKKKKCFLRRKKAEEPEYTSKGNLLTVFDPVSGDKSEFKDVSNSSISENGKFVYFSELKTFDKVDSVQVYLLNVNSGVNVKVGPGYNGVSGLTMNEQENALAFLSTEDTSDVQFYSLRHFDVNSLALRVLADTNSVAIDSKNSVSTNYSPRFTKDGRFLYFGTAERPEKEPEDTLIASEKVKLDLWHYEDKRLQPQQLLELKRDEKKTNLFIYRFAENKMVKLSDDTLSVWADSNPQWNSNSGVDHFYLGVSDEAYAGTYNWVLPYPKDYYLVSATTGERKLIKRGVEFGMDLSPAAKYLTYYSSENHNHYIIDTRTMKETCVTCSIDNVNWEEDVNGMPMKPYPNGVIGWNRDENTIYVQGELDVWEYHTNDGSVTSTTQEIGKETNVEIRTKRWTYDSVYVDFDNVYFTGFDRKTKGRHFYGLQDHGDHADLKELNYFNAEIVGLERSKDKSMVVGRKMTFQNYPDLYEMDNNFQLGKRISVANPQQSEYKWGTVELISWTSYDGIELEGLLYKPEDFDASKKYPLMVYFYELYTDRYHYHYIPKPTASIIYPTEYASAGYVVFIPDIRYKAGHPAQSAYDCILSGTDRVLELYPNVDSTRMALQGQSWGGYQTAQLVTMTNRYKAAMAGAPVTNMFSAYGGIRWGSGLNRQFQYERTQSRIGYTIWERPDLYVENSPQFHLPNVETPLLIMHNDNDGAVPWYQGIELFTGLKRLGKPVWMLNYNGEEHNLMQNANRMDLSIRMRQFFDHYLLGEEAPEWLINGIPATVKGKELRY